MTDILQQLTFLFQIITAFMFFIYKMTNYIYLPASVAVMVYAYFKDRDQYKTSLIWVSKFIAVMVVVFFVRLALMEGGKATPIGSLSFSAFLTVFLEDAFFVMIPFYICKKVNNKTAQGFIWLFFSVLFGIGHLYQGISGFFITALYPFFISNHFAKKTSFLNVMICHFLYDSFTLFAVKIAFLLQHT